jgi:hypothetical protein
MRVNIASASVTAGARSRTRGPVSVGTSAIPISCTVADGIDARVYWIYMAITFNHTIVAARDRAESATFFTDLFGLPSAKEFGHFLAVTLNHGVSLDYAQVGPEEDIRPSTTRSWSPRTSSTRSTAASANAG